MKRILSFDIDLNRFHAWSNVEGRVCYNETLLPVAAIQSHDLILIEVASPLMYDKKPAVVHRKVAWAIFNTYMAVQIFSCTKPPQQVLVSPSHEWTNGYEEAVRQSMADVTGEDNHDIREVRTMQFFYGLTPQKWVPFATYFNSFTFSDTSLQAKFKAKPKGKR